MDYNIDSFNQPLNPGECMYSVSWIQNGRVFQANTPDKSTANMVYHNMRQKLGLCVRLWHTKVKGKPCLVI